MIPMCNAYLLETHGITDFRHLAELNTERPLETNCVCVRVCILRVSRSVIVFVESAMFYGIAPFIDIET